MFLGLRDLPGKGRARGLFASTQDNFPSAEPGAGVEAVDKADNAIVLPGIKGPGRKQTSSVGRSIWADGGGEKYWVLWEPSQGLPLACGRGIVDQGRPSRGSDSWTPEG